MTDKARELLERAADALTSDDLAEQEEVFEEIRAYLAEQKQYDALADRYVEGVTSGLEKCREYMDAQVWVAKELLSIREPEVKREALNEETIRWKYEKTEKNLRTVALTEYGWFDAGVRFAEKHHGIGRENESSSRL